MSIPSIRLVSTVIGTPDPQGLSRFYEALLGWPRTMDEPDWVKLTSTETGQGLSFQAEPEHVPPQWPNVPGGQQMQLHLDLKVDDLDAAGAHALSVGAVLADHQPQDGVRIYFDPAGHPFCLFEH